MENNGHTIYPIAHFCSPFKSKFGIPRQGGLIEELEGTIVLEPYYRQHEALRGLEEFDYIWLIWGFSANEKDKNKESDTCTPSLTVRPPRMGGNIRMGVFATRSPFRPNGLGLSSVRISRIEWECKDGPVIHVLGADLMDGTPIYDMKPYLKQTDCHVESHGGFTERHEWKLLDVVFDNETEEALSEEERKILSHILELDPRPHYQNDKERTYGMTFGRYDIHFKVDGNVLRVSSIVIH